MSSTLVLVTQATQVTHLGPNLACAAGLGLLTFLYTRMPVAQAATYPVRALLLEALGSGRCFSVSELARLAGVSRKTAEYHIHILERTSLVARLPGGKRPLFVKAGHARSADTSARALEHPARRALLDAARANPGLTVPQLAKVLGMAPSTAYFHARVLAAHGLLLVRPDAVVEVGAQAAPASGPPAEPVKA